MKYMMKHWTILGVLGGLAACAHNPPPADPARVAQEPALPTFNDQEVVTLYERMATQLAMPATTRVQLAERLKGVLANPDFAANKRQGIQGVVVYSGAEGGLLLKFSSGKGLVGFKNQEPRAITLRSTSLGAQVGGSREWGVGLLLGLSKAGYFGGDYVGSSTEATLITSSMTVHKLRPAEPSSDEAKHQLYALGQAAGASADAGGVRLTINYATP